MTRGTEELRTASANHRALELELADTTARLARVQKDLDHHAQRHARATDAA